MKRTDLNTRDIYARRASIYDRPLPTRLVDATRMWVHRNGGIELSRHHTCPEQPRGYRGHHVGFLALTVLDAGRRLPEEALHRLAETIAALPLPPQTDTVDQLPPLPENTALIVVDNRALKGTWAQVYAAWTAERQRKQQEKQNTERRRAEGRRDFAAAHQLMCQLGHDSAVLNPDASRVSLSLADFLALATKKAGEDT